MNDRLIPSFQSCYDRLEECKISDVQPFRRRLRKIKQQQDFTTLKQLAKKIESSVAAVKQRRQQSPAISYPPDLPVSQKKQTIADAISTNQVVIVCGETGSGKTTQLPKICLELGLGCKGYIGHTQPRRLAARAVASRIAEELHSCVGDAVGYKVRFNDQTSQSSYIKLMTDGILLAECHTDPWLNQYDTLIIDEAHERSLNIDFLLGYLKRLLVKRKDLKIIITSATIDPGIFSRHFNHAQVINVSGRSFAVDVLYRPLQIETQDQPFQQKTLPQGILDAITELSARQRGDILVFLSGERDIRETTDFLNKQVQTNRYLRHTEILPLLARQSAIEQNRIFHPGNKQRIILATNVAETSLTVPGIKYVIDSGLARISRYSWRSKIQRLPIEKISQASANQRKGRCGRISEGICIRLYDEDDFNNRDEFTPPEIKRTNLAAVILQMEYLRLGHISDFPFVEPPEPKMINDGYRLLYELEAITKDNSITAIGKKLARLPIDPRLGRMLIEAEHEAALNEVLIIVAALATQDVRERPMDKQQAADEKHRIFIDKQSDFLFYLNCWKDYHLNKNELSANQLRKWCKKHFLSWLRFREWIDTHRQIKIGLKTLKFHFNTQTADYAGIHRALLSGLLANIGFKDEKNNYFGTRNRKFRIFPGSVLFKKSSRWIMAAEIVETSQIYARINSDIESQWVEEKAGHLIKCSYQEPYWQQRQAQVSALEQVSLYGLILYTDKKINYSRINPAECRDIFIRHALVREEFDCHADFFLHNKKIITEIESLEAKSRKLDILIDEDIQFAYFSSFIPADVCNGPQFNRWYKKCAKITRKKLFLSKQQLMAHDASGINETLFPDYLTINNIPFPLQYHFAINHEHDGIVMIIPVSCLASIQAQRCEWLVPGLLKDKMIALIRSLPKSIRRNFIPAPDYAQACYEALEPSDLALTTAMSTHLKKMSGVSIPYDAWQLTQLESHFFIYFRVVDGENEVLAQGRDLALIKDQLATYKNTAIKNTGNSIEKENVKADILDTLADKVEQKINGINVFVYPSLVKHGDKVTLINRVSASQAKNESLTGLRQLFINAMPAQIKDLKRFIVDGSIPDSKKLCLKYATFGSCDELKSDIINAVISEIFLSSSIHSYNDFQQTLNKGKSQLYKVCTNWCQLINTILDDYHKIKPLVKKPPLSLLHTMNDIQEQIKHLFPQNFITNIDSLWLKHYPRYLKAINRRVEKAQHNSAGDRQLHLKLSPLWQQYIERENSNKTQHKYSAQLQHYRWMLEEYRVSLFAQDLKTQLPVSEKRLKKYWHEIADV